MAACGLAEHYQPPPQLTTPVPQQETVVQERGKGLRTLKEQVMDTGTEERRTHLLLLLLHLLLSLLLLRVLLLQPLLLQQQPARRRRV